MAEMDDFDEDSLPEHVVQNALDPNFQLPPSVEPGSPEARVWWNHVVAPGGQEAVTDDMRQQYGDKVKGAWKGKPLVPGEAGPGQGDFQYLVDRLIITQGYEPDRAARIAGAAKQRMYG